MNRERKITGTGIYQGTFNNHPQPFLVLEGEAEDTKYQQEKFGTTKDVYIPNEPSLVSPDNVGKTLFTGDKLGSSYEYVK